MNSYTINKIGQEALGFATKCHKDVNQTYGHGLPYGFHLRLVQRIAYKYLSLIGDKSLQMDVIQAAALHDVLEDTHLTYNDLRKSELRVADSVADIVYALTNEKGKTRAERANAAYYEGINNTRGAVFVKLCDRIANVLYGAMFGGSMFDKYKKENEHFINSLDTRCLEVMVLDLENLFKFKTFCFEVV